MKEPPNWKLRLKDLGLTQRMLGFIIGHRPQNVSRQLWGEGKRGIPRHVIAAILAWEIMTPAQRQEWLDAIAKLDGSNLLYGLTTGKLPRPSLDQGSCHKSDGSP